MYCEIINNSLTKAEYKKNPDQLKSDPDLTTHLINSNRILKKMKKSIILLLPLLSD